MDEVFALGVRTRICIATWVLTQHMGSSLKFRRPYRLHGDFKTWVRIDSRIHEIETQHAGRFAARPLEICQVIFSL